MMNTAAVQAELAMMDVVPGTSGTTPHAEGDVLVIALAPHKVGPPPRGGKPDTRVKHWPGQHYYCSPASAADAASRNLVHIVGEATFDWWTTPGRVLSPFPEDVEQPYLNAPVAGSLKIAQGAGYDPGNAAYRFHSAVNQCSQHSSGFVRWGDTNPYCSSRQLDGERDAAKARDMVSTADVLHNHIGYFLPNNTGIQVQPGQVLVIHYHGSRPDGRPLCGDRFPGTKLTVLEWDVIRRAKVVAARLTLVDEIKRVAHEKRLRVEPEWVPIAVDVARYRALVPTVRPDGPFRIAHSPTNRRFKGSDVYDAVMARLRAKGVPVQPVTIMNMSHGDALRVKATCDAVFDSFWLGMQGSGLEGAAMGLPVIAGDPVAADAHRAFCGHVPWTYANNETELAAQIERLATDPAYYTAEAQRVHAFVAAHHDYPAVARHYERLLAHWTGRDDVVTPPRAVSPHLKRKRR